MNTGYYVRSEIRFDKLATTAAYAEIPAQQCLRGSRSEADQDLRLDYRELGIQPWPARLDFRVAGFF